MDYSRGVTFKFIENIVNNNHKSTKWLEIQFMT